MLDVLVSQVMLDCTGVVTVVGELEPASMAQHVGVHLRCIQCNETKTSNYVIVSIHLYA